MVMPPWPSTRSASLARRLERRRCTAALQGEPALRTASTFLMRSSLPREYGETGNADLSSMGVAGKSEVYSKLGGLEEAGRRPAA